MVVPRSLLFNWRQEATRFTPELRVLVHEGRDRARDVASFARLRPRAHHLRHAAPRRAAAAETEFDYVILDEAQAIKNAKTGDGEGGAAAAREASARDERHAGREPHRRALEPVRVPEPRHARRRARVQGVRHRATRSEVGPDAHRARGAAVHPAAHEGAGRAGAAGEARADDLRASSSRSERKRYDELRDHYRAALLGRVDKRGHREVEDPDPRGAAAPAAGGVSLRPARRDARGGVEQQVRPAASRSSRRSWPRGTRRWCSRSSRRCWRCSSRSSTARRSCTSTSTARRATARSASTRFQTDPACGVFLISLKAGGLGLNLTAADYVFLLDPWWNPAVEAQAIDRAHRIGQTRRVFASRLIARDTVEEKVLELQQSKRDLAEAIIGGDNSLIARIRREDLEVLLG